MTHTKSSEWFGQHFNHLAPLLRQLHTHGSELTGPVDITIANGVAGRIGRRIADMLGIPTDSHQHTLKVVISHNDDGLSWDRCFDEQHLFYSTFTAVGTIENGYWLETTGAIQLMLTVDIKHGGWYWRTLKASFKGIPIPLWLLPGTHAYKVIENNAYRFYVGISVPLFGEVLSYSGLLKPHVNTPIHSQAAQ